MLVATAAPCPVFRYDRQKCEVKHIKDMQLLAAMAPPGGERQLVTL